jgi:hypothetical protein
VVEEVEACCFLKAGEATDATFQVVVTTRGEGDGKADERDPLVMPTSVRVPIPLSSLSFVEGVGVVVEESYFSEAGEVTGAMIQVEVSMREEGQEGQADVKMLMVLVPMPMPMPMSHKPQ